MVALVDASPGWDSTAITAGVLMLTGAVIAAVAGERLWLWALLLGLPTPIVEGAVGGSAGSVLALAFAAAGAAIGWAVRRAG